MNRKAVLAREICLVDSCPNNYDTCSGAIQSKCIERKYCCINSLSVEQIEYIFSEVNTNIYLKACPGSGKTEVIGLKVAHEVKKWLKPNSGIAVLTFTNSAENEIMSRVSHYLNRPLDYPHYVGTFTSWLHGYIANPFLCSFISSKQRDDKSIRLFDDNSFLNIALSFQTKYTYGVLNKLNPTQYYFSLSHNKIIYHNKEKQTILDEMIEKDNWRQKELLEIKNEFNRANLYTYEDIEQKVYSLLCEKKELAKYLSMRYSLILIDECQDLSTIQIAILHLLKKNGSKIHLVGDLDQSIYEFRWVNPDDTQKYIKDHKYIEMQLTNNFRSTQEIVEISKFVLNRDDSITGCQKKLVEKPLRIIFYNQNSEAEAINKYKKLLIEDNLSIDNSYVIVRNNSLKRKLIGDRSIEENTLESLAKAIHYHRNYSSKTDFNEMFIYSGKSINRVFFGKSIGGNKNNYYCPDSFAKSEWRIFVLDVINRISSDKTIMFNITWKEWKKVISSKLEEVKQDISSLSDKNIDLGKIRNKMGDKTVGEMFNEVNSSIDNMNIATIHGSKGMSLDSVLCLSSYKSDLKSNGSYWKQWFDNSIISEKNRLAYVAFSRAKYLLVLAIPKHKKFTSEEFEVLYKNGFIEY